MKTISEEYARRLADRLHSATQRLRSRSDGTDGGLNLIVHDIEAVEADLRDVTK